ncbi:STAS/SEC14 domain-containing protein [Mycobacterium sp. NPDC003449]
MLLVLRFRVHPHQPRCDLQHRGPHRTHRRAGRPHESFDGWDLSAAWANTLFDLRHRTDFEKVAMVGAPKWEEWCVKVPAAVLMRGALRTFPLDRLDDARAWLNRHR